MTNAEKYLKDGVSVEEFAEFLKSKQPNNKYGMIFHDIVFWLNAKATPILTEDEKVILRNIDKKFKSIKRANDSYLYLVTEDNAFRDIRYEFEMFPNLFQFIKERRRILH